MITERLLNSFRTWSSEKIPLVMASVFSTSGSTYSKAGANMLMTGDGRFSGMLSGGCLEGDLVEHAKAVVNSRCPKKIIYDLKDIDDGLWNLGVGCDGKMEVLLVPIFYESKYEPFKSILEILNSNSIYEVAIVIESDIENLLVGSTIVFDGTKIIFSNFDSKISADMTSKLNSLYFNNQSLIYDYSNLNGSAKIFFYILEPPPKILILGGGLDAEPLLNIADELGWRVTIQDHRPSYIDVGNFQNADRILCESIIDLPKFLNFNDFDAAVVMSHHLDSDKSYLEYLSKSNIKYIELLGPANRKKRLLNALDDESAEMLKERLYGPAGIDLGGRGPGSIALSIIAQIHKNIFL